MNQREYNDKRTHTELREHVAVLENQILGLAEVAAENERLLKDNAAILRIVLDYVIESNDCGGIDCNDLMHRLESAGYPLPDEEDE